MLKVISTILLLFSFLTYGFAQNTRVQLLKNSIEISKIDTLDETMYDKVSEYKVIMIGEMHGTEEPAAFVKGLVRLFVINQQKVNVYLEISADEMKQYIKKPRISKIKKTTFFKKYLSDGRAGWAWHNIISELGNMTEVRLVFFDSSKEQNKQSENRDSLMYVNIKQDLIHNGVAKSVILTGNLHNMLIPRKGEKKMGYYLKNDSELGLGAQILSVDHIYGSGSMLNNIGNGLEKQIIPFAGSKYDGIFDSFLYIFPKDYADFYNAYFYTKYVTATKLVNSKK